MVTCVHTHTHTHAHTIAEDQLLYLDPHTVQPTINITDHQHIPDQSYHCAPPDRIPISDLDPSIALGFFCKNEEELDDLIRRLKSVRNEKKTHNIIPTVVTVCACKV